MRQQVREGCEESEVFSREKEDGGWDSALSDVSRAEPGGAQ